MLPTQIKFNINVPAVVRAHHVNPVMTCDFSSVRIKRSTCPCNYVFKTIVVKTQLLNIEFTFSKLFTQSGSSVKLYQHQTSVLMVNFEQLHANFKALNL